MQGVWAGWGHASENPKLPEKLFKLNIAFLGPSASAMWALGKQWYSFMCSFKTLNVCNILYTIIFYL